MKFLEFIKYCFECLFDGISCVSGHVPDGYTWKDAFIGISTLIFLMLIIGFIIFIIKICKKNKNKRKKK